jgi:hypothetical protein
MKVAEGHRAAERREEHRLAAEASLQERGHQLCDAAERRGPLDLRGLAHDDDLKAAQQEVRAEQQISRLLRRACQERHHRPAPP